MPLQVTLYRRRRRDRLYAIVRRGKCTPGVDGDVRKYLYRTNIFWPRLSEKGYLFPSFPGSGDIWLLAAGHRRRVVPSLKTSPGSVVTFLAREPYYVCHRRNGKLLLFEYEANTWPERTRRKSLSHVPGVAVFYSSLDTSVLEDVTWPARGCVDYRRATNKPKHSS